MIREVGIFSLNEMSDLKEAEKMGAGEVKPGRQLRKVCEHSILIETFDVDQAFVTPDTESGVGRGGWE